jgi:hypothetical protein
LPKARSGPSKKPSRDTDIIKMIFRIVILSEVVLARAMLDRATARQPF